AGRRGGRDAMTRVLLTTVHRDFGLYDYFRENAPEGFAWRFRMPRRISFGLRFLRQNIPGIEILEYPTHAEYRRALARGWGVGGFLFFFAETNEILRMGGEARAAGAGRPSGGELGAPHPGVRGRRAAMCRGYRAGRVSTALG